MAAPTALGLGSKRSRGLAAERLGGGSVTDGTLTGKPTKHEIARLRPVFDGDRYCGSLVHTAKGYVVYDRHSNSVGCFQNPEKGAARLRALGRGLIDAQP
jgi:hypothetical protein